jgi:hypothetical protein
MARLKYRNRKQKIACITNLNVHTWFDSLCCYFNFHDVQKLIAFENRLHTWTGVERCVHCGKDDPKSKRTQRILKLLYVPKSEDQNG